MTDQPTPEQLDPAGGARLDLAEAAFENACQGEDFQWQRANNQQRRAEALQEQLTLLEKAADNVLQGAENVLFNLRQTGKGLDHDEAMRIFQRFADQLSPRQP